MPDSNFEQHLAPEDLLALQSAFTNTGELYDPPTRRALLSGISNGFIGNLILSGAPFTQLVLDLERMNRTERLRNGTIPLIIWLRNAAHMFGELQQGEVFQKYLSLLSSKTSGAPQPPPSAKPQFIPEVTYGRDDAVSVGFLERGYKAATAVGKLLIPAIQEGSPLTTKAGDQKYFWGTAWMLTADLIITNYHVATAREEGELLPSPSDLEAQIQKAVIQFDFDAEGMEGTKVNVTGLEAFNADLDYAVMRLAVPALTIRPPLRLKSDTAFDVTPGKPMAANIIQHPQGGPKKVALRNNLVYSVLGTHLQYFSETDRGSSGSPVFDDTWRVIALHHGSVYVPNLAAMHARRNAGWVNQGVHIGSILSHLQTQFSSIYSEVIAN